MYFKILIFIFIYYLVIILFLIILLILIIIFSTDLNFFFIKLFCFFFSSFFSSLLSFSLLSSPSLFSLSLSQAYEEEFGTELIDTNCMTLHIADTSLNTQEEVASFAIGQINVFFVDQFGRVVVCDFYFYYFLYFIYFYLFLFILFF